MKLNRRVSALPRCIVFAGAILMTAGYHSTAIAQESYPSRPVKVVVGYAPGGSSDTVGRILANNLQKEYGQTFVVENKPGAGGLLAAHQVARAKPDGDTLLMVIGSHTILPSVQKKMPYDTANDFAPVAMIGNSPNMLVVPAHSKWKNLDDFLTAAKTSSTPINYATPGIGTTTHVTAAMIEQAAGIKLNHIPYKSSSEVLQAVLSDQVPVAVTSIITAGQAIRDGRARALAIVGASRSPLLPDVPTFDELGIKGILGDNWLGLLAPAQAPQKIVADLEHTIKNLLSKPAFQDSLKAQGMVPKFGSATEFDNTIRHELRAYSELAKVTELVK